MEISDKVITWLLEDDNPPVRYLTQTMLLNRSETTAEVRHTKTRLMEYKVTKGILKHSNEFWKNDDKAYWKYTGKFWQLIFLGQFLADGRNHCIVDGVNDILKKRNWVMKSGGQCLTANILAALMRLGFGNHPMVMEETESLARRFLTDCGIKCTAMDYSLLSHCYMGLSKLLLCFAQIPEGKRSSAVTNAIELIVETLLANEVYIYVPGNRREWQKILAQQPKRADLPAGQTVKDWISDQKGKFLVLHGVGIREAKQGWLKFGFPLHYNSDVLEAMYALAIVNTPMTPKLHKPLQAIKSKMAPEGTWKLENSLNGKMWVDVEEKGKPSKWITYFALYVLNHFEN